MALPMLEAMIPTARAARQAAGEGQRKMLRPPTGRGARAGEGGTTSVARRGVRRDSLSAAPPHRGDALSSLLVADAAVVGA